MKKFINTLSHGMLFLFITTWYGCQKTPDSISPPIDPLEEKVTASINGRITDDTGKPVSSAQVQAGASVTSTDINGVFRFSNLQLSKNAGFVKVEKDGYFNTGRTIFTSAGVVNNVEIKLIPKKEKGNFQATAGATIPIESGMTVNFPANAIVDKSTNSVYSGAVKVFGTYLNPEDPNLASIMPGNLTGIDINNEQKILQTYGMIAVELEGSNGEQLNLANAKQATINFPIPSSLLANAPATIPLWYFDETLGVWKEEGTAAKQGNAYVGTVSHFSFWNCDVPADFINLTLTLKNQNQELLPGYRVGLRNTQNNSHAYGYTDSSGSVNGGVPVGVPVELLVYDKCNTVIHTQNIGPFNTDTDLGIVTITTGYVSVNVSGTVVTCNQAPVTNGFVDIFLEGNGYRAAINNGSFSISIKKCSSSTIVADVVATDLEANKQSAVLNIPVTSGDYTANLDACGTSIQQFINYSIGANTFNFLQTLDSLTGYRSGSSTVIQAFRKQADSSNYQYSSFNFTGEAAPGTYNMSTGTFMVMRGIPSTIEYAMEGPISITITEYGGPSQFVAGSFTGNFRERYSNAVVSGTCNFRVRRF